MSRVNIQLADSPASLPVAALAASALPGGPASLPGAASGASGAAGRPKGLIRANHLWAAAWAVTAVIVYASLVPFTFKRGVAVESVGDFLHWCWGYITAVRWNTWPISEVSSLGNNNRVVDWVVNTGLYVLPAALLRLHARSRGMAWWRGVATGTVTIFCVSWLVECTQALMMPDRNVALQDVIANTGGAFVAALVAPAAAGALYHTTVYLYRKVAFAAHTAGDFVERQRRRPWLMFVVAAANAALVAGWLLGAWLPGEEKFTEQNNLMPFARQLDRSYDVAAIQLGRSFLVYCLIGALLSVQLLSFKNRRKLGLLVLLLAALGLIHEVVRHRLTGIGVDVTQPLLALMAVGFVLTIAVLLTHAVRASCRRGSQVPVANDRRRRRHEYT